MKNLIFLSVICFNCCFPVHGKVLSPDKPPRTTFTYDDMNFEVGLKKNIRLLFGYDRPELTLEDRKVLDSVYYFLVANPNLKLEIVCHTDTRGSDKYNRAISARRATLVLDHLVFLGIHSDRLTSRGAGGDELLLSDDYIRDNAKTKSEKELLHFKNRRTELKISGTDYISTSNTEIILPEKPCINNESLELIVGKGCQQIALSPYSVLMLTRSFQKQFPDITFFSEKDIIISYSKDDCKKNVLFIRSINGDKPELLGKKEEREIYHYNSCKDAWVKLDF